MVANIKTKWIDALRSGKYKQTSHTLKDDIGFCCLGVLCDIQNANFDVIREQHGSLSLSSNPAEYFGDLPSGFSVKVASMNDDGKTFAEIADYIEEHL